MTGSMPTSSVMACLRRSRFFVQLDDLLYPKEESPPRGEVCLGNRTMTGNIMKTNQLLIILCGLLAGLLALIAPQPAFAGGLHIHPVFLGGDPPPPSSIAGGGNLQAIFAVAAKKWERVFRQGPDSWDITIEYIWADTLAD